MTAHERGTKRANRSGRIESLGRSIAFQGIVVPLLVRPSGDHFELVAGFTASQPRPGPVSLKCSSCCEVDTQDAGRAAENITRAQARNRHDSGVSRYRYRT